MSLEKEVKEEFLKRKGVPEKYWDYLIYYRAHPNYKGGFLWHHWGSEIPWKYTPPNNWNGDEYAFRKIHSRPKARKKIQKSLMTLKESTNIGELEKLLKENRDKEIKIYYEFYDEPATIVEIISNPDYDKDLAEYKKREDLIKEIDNIIKEYDIGIKFIENKEEI